MRMMLVSTDAYVSGSTRCASASGCTWPSQKTSSALPKSFLRFQSFLLIRYFGFIKSSVDNDSRSVLLGSDDLF